MSTQNDVVGPTPSRGRGIGFYVLLVLAALLLLLSAFAVWVNRVALNTDVFVGTSTELIEDEAIRTAVATRAVDELFESVDVQAEIEAQLPRDYKSLSGPATAGLRQASYSVVERALERPALQRLWAISLEQSHRTLVEVLEEREGAISTSGGIVTLDLEQIVLEAADRIGLRAQVEDKLPAEVGRIEVLRSDELDTAQDATQLLKTLAWLLPLLTLAAFALAVWLARDRRRAARAIGVALLVVGLLGVVAVRLAGNYVVDSLVAETENRTAASNAWEILTDLLRASFWWLAVVGILFVVAAWLAGSGRRAVATRRAIAPAFRQRTWAYGALGVVALILLLSSPVTDFTRLLTLVVFVTLVAVWIELTRRQTLQEFPDAGGAAFLGDARTRMASWWEGRRRAPVEVQQVLATPAADVSARLAALADLHARGELTDDEFGAAKARVLAGD